jgi:hypothetical protein
MSGDRISALRHAREIAEELRRHGMAAPPTYASMAHEFQDLVRTRGYAAGLTGSETPRGARPGASRG